ncbi:MAG TPA: type III pantothenate kinase [Clostridiales bacterium]|nr:type III pantothenate kinase [Clostridiales bacterium]
MLLVIDVGNTNITVGIYDQTELIVNFRITTNQSRTADEYGMILLDFLNINNISKDKIKGAIISTVVPKIMYFLKQSINKYFNINPLMVEAGTKTGIKISAVNPREIGADRIVDAVAGYKIYGGPVIVIDFGTAITYDLITSDGSFAAGVTSPGLEISANALWSETAKLPEIEIKKPDSILAKETVTSMQAGLVYGCIGQTEYIIKKIKEESGFLDAKVIATGGLGYIIAESTDSIDIYDPLLTLKGLKIIADLNKVLGR